MSEFIENNLWEVLGFIFIAGVTLAGLRMGIAGLSTKIDQQTAIMQRRFDGLEKKDGEHDLRLNDHAERLARVESDVSNQGGWLRGMRDQVSAIHEKMMRT